MKPISFWHRLLDLISPRLCVVCGNRLTITEESICTRCNFHLPRTDFGQTPYDNEMAKLFWGQIPIERASALFYYESHSETANIIYQLKYKNHPEIGKVMGRLMAKECRLAISSMESMELYLFRWPGSASVNVVITRVSR